MKCEISTNSFCPVGCPYLAIESDSYIDNSGQRVYVKRYCRHQSLCKYAYDMGKDNVKDFANKLIAKIHSRYEYGEKMTDNDAYACQYISDFVKEFEND